MLYHDIGILWPGNRYEKKLVTLVSYGEVNGYTAMAKTVGIPAAIAANMVLNGKIFNGVFSGRFTVEQIKQLPRFDSILCNKFLLFYFHIV